ncbi:MAG TPA: hypothetical protein VF524_03595 [Polyangia bacterium]
MLRRGMKGSEDIHQELQPGMAADVTKSLFLQVAIGPVAVRVL